MLKEKSKIKVIFFLGFLLSLHLAFTSYVNSSFLAVFAGEKNVSLIYILSSLSSLVMLFFVPKILRRGGVYRFLLYSSGLNALSLLLLFALPASIAIPLVFIFYFTLNNLIIFALDELLQIFSRNESMGRVRGLYLSITNVAWIVSQALVGGTLSYFSFHALYFIAFVIMYVFFFATLLSLRNVTDPKYDSTFGLQSFKNFFGNKNLARAYKMNFLLQFFYVWMVIYTPIYLYAHLGFAWREIAMIFTLMLLPFALIQFPLGRHSDKVGERKMLIFGFLIISLATLSLFFIKSHSILVWAIALFSTRVGAAMIEVMSDVYFFKHIKRENDEFISVYRNTSSVSYVIAPLVALVTFSLVPSFKFIFLVLGAIMLYGVYLASTIKRSDV